MITTDKALDNTDRINRLMYEIRSSMYGEIDSECDAINNLLIQIRVKILDKQRQTN